MTPTTEVLKPVRTTKSGIDLSTFTDVSLYKTVPPVPAVESLKDALARVQNNEAKLLTIIRDGLQAEAVSSARDNQAGWLKQDDDGKDTSEVFEGTLVSGEILNPLVLNLARTCPCVISRNGVEVEVTWEDAKSADEKRAIKAATVDFIRSTPRIMEGLKKKMQATPATA